MTVMYYLLLPFMIADFLNTIIIGDKGYISEPFRQELYDDYGINLLTQKRSNQKNSDTRYRYSLY
jgi:hypothetical protein